MPVPTASVAPAIEDPHTAMKIANLPRTELRVSRLCLGMMSFGDPKWQGWVRDEAAGRDIVRRALDAGINFFDTADVYSFGESERILGVALADAARREDVVVATKFGLAQGIDVQGLRKHHVLEAAEASLKRLGTDYIDLYQMHGWDSGVPIEETLEALTMLRDQGKIRYAGASNFFAWQLAVSHCASETQDLVRLSTMQFQYNLLYREEEREMLPYCSRSETGVICFSPLARGYLIGSPGASGGTAADLRAATDKKRQRLYDSGSFDGVLDAVDHLARAKNLTRNEIAFAWVLANPLITSAIIGPSEPEHLASAVAAMEVELSDDEIAALNAPYGARPTEVTEISKVPF